MHPPALHSVQPDPLLFWAVQNTLCILIIAFTPPTSPIRLCFLPLLSAGVLYIFPHIRSSTKYPLWAGLLGAGILSGVLQYIEVALSSKWSFQAGGPTLTAAQELISEKKRVANGTAEKAVRSGWEEIPRKTGGGEISEPLRFGYYAMFSNRHCGTPYEVNNVPRFSDKDPDYIPSRGAFLLRKAVVVSACYLVLDLVALGMQSATKEAEQTAAVPGSREHANFLIHHAQLSVLPFLKKIPLTASFWFVSHCFIQSFFSVFAFIRVACGLDSVSFWRPNFGSLSNAYSLRQFWGVFWHQHIRLKLAAIPNLIVYRFIRLSKGGSITRYVHLFLVFLTSGILHTGIDVVSGIAPEHSPALRFFLMQAAGIMFEDGVQALYRAITGGKRDAKQRPERWQRWLGYCWVILYLTWSSEMKVKKTRMEGRGEVLPFGVVGPVLRVVRRLR